ncbi:glycosyltransferase family 4 protein [Rufibacter glacialis]|uniref:Glycosyltransferase family 4 protein n=1 Tax=Rufibacter glacialis TaxID=1259555 RepID=A0A5M8Q6H7_9BACT|nr:glycosyltransferase family 4 protein [Rufibacter glacialis]KAA6430222.1 glycosyltransferase family 4 protein [Rufibacter glacialis]GGK87478.1 glycosyl transferase [Rufibacter glacialis]
MRIAIVINKSWNIFNFRLSLVKALLAAGHEVVAIAPKDAYSARLVAEGCRFVPLPMESKGTNPLKDMLLVGKFLKAYKSVQPDVILQYTIKPNIYGSVAARLAGIPTINNVSGLGTVFIVENLVSKIAMALYRFSFQFPAKVFFQNTDDKELFLERKLVRESITEVIPGSGIDTKRYLPAPQFKRQEPFVFLMVSRALYEKGLVEYVEASKILKAKYPQIRVQLLGAIDEEGNIGIKRTLVEQWAKEGWLEFLGTSDDVAGVVHGADCVVLPSYREGTPRTLLEAAAMAKPIVTTNVPGCKETVIDGYNGYLCQVRNAVDLAAKMEQVYLLAEPELQAMGQNSRRLAEEKFDEKFVIERYFRAIESATKGKGD